MVLSLFGCTAMFFSAPFPGITYDPEVAEIIGSVSQDSVRWTISSLSGETPVIIDGMSDSLPMRYAYSPGSYKAALWLREQMETKGLDAELEPAIADFFLDADILPSGYGWAASSGWVSKYIDGVYLYRTEDAGASWKGVRNDTSSWNKVIAVSEDSMWGVAGTRIVRTTDGGQSFQTLLDAGVVLSALSCLNRNDCWAAGGTLAKGFLLSTEDGWETFKSDSFPGTGYISHVDFVSRDTGWLVASKQHLRGTTDGGESLALLYPPVGTIHDIELLDSRTGYVLGKTPEQQGRIVKTTDAGVSWQILKDSLGALPLAISIPGRDTVWVSCDSGVLLVSYDAGQTWTRNNLPTKARLSTIDVSSNGSGCIAGELELLYSTDLVKWQSPQVTDGNVMWNVVGELPGEDSTQVLITAHYDARSESDTWTPGADDNASGVAAVMETARLLAGRSWKHTLRFICFGGEEVGMVGSRGYAYKAYERGDSILAVLNSDMIGYDGNKDRLVEINAKPFESKSAGAAKMLDELISIYGLELDPVIRTTDSKWNSDHSSFWLIEVPALFLGEDRKDFNPFYHSTGDRLKELDAFYLTENVRAAVGWMSVAANLDSLAGVDEPIIPERPEELVALSLSSTVLRSQGTLTITSPYPVTPSIYDASGRKVATLTTTSYSASSPSSPATVHFDLSDLPAGVYWVSVQGVRGMVSARFVLIR